MKEGAINDVAYKEQILSNKIKRMWRGMTQHGLFLYTSRNILSKLGIDINPYWIEKEGVNLCEETFTIDNANNYRLAVLDLSELKKLAGQLKWLAPALQKYELGKYRVIGLYEENRLAAFTMAQFDEFEYKGKHFKLKSNEAYLENMYTFEDYRGKKLAPYLRYQSYKLLSEEGKNEFYSITQYFNKSSLKFKAKLNAQHLESWLYIGLFKRYGRNFLLKDLKKESLTRE